MIITPEYIKQKLEPAFPDSIIEVIDMDGIGQHFSLSLKSPRFVGLTKLKQHRLVYDALGEDMKDTIHALMINTEPI